MKRKSKKIYSGNLHIIIRFLLALSLVAIAGLFVHELGHGFTAQLMGGTMDAFYIAPGIQIWPNLGEPYQKDWLGYVALIFYSPGGEWQPAGVEEGYVEIMGSGSTLIVAMLTLTALFFFRPTGWLRSFLFASGWLFTDVLFYTFLPLVGLRHWLFFGGDTAEPLLGAEKLGIAPGIFILFVALVSLLMLFGLIRFARQNPLWPKPD